MIAVFHQPLRAPPRECEPWRGLLDCQHRERFFPLTRKTERLIWHLKKRIYARAI